MSRVCMMCTVYCVLCAVYCVRCGAYCAVHTVRVADASYYMCISPSVPLPCVFVLFPQRLGTVGEMTGWASHYSGNDVMGSSLTVRCCRENGLASSKRERTTAYTIAPMHLGTLC